MTALNTSIRKVRAWVTLLGVGVMLIACSGKDGAPGMPGTAGPPGPPGPTGPPNSGSIDVFEAETIEVTIQRVDIDSNDWLPTVVFRLTDARGLGLFGLPADNIAFNVAALHPGRNGGSSQWQSYIVRDDGGVADAQAGTEAAGLGQLDDLGGGEYRYRFANALPAYSAGPSFDETLVHRVGLEIRLRNPDLIPANDATIDFVPAGGAAMQSRAIITNQSCNQCHDKLAQHGQARKDVRYCVQCHNPFSIDGNTGNSVDMTIMTHKIHHGSQLTNGYQIVGFNDRLFDYSTVQFSQDTRRCTACHNASLADAPQAENWYRVANRTACGSCHDDIDWLSPFSGHPGGLVFADDSQCIDCHGPDSTVNGGALRTEVVHRIDAQLASKRFAFNVLELTDTAPGQQPLIRFSITDPSDNDRAYDLAADPAFTACVDGTSRIAVLLGWQTSDYTNTMSGQSPAQPVSINPLIAAGCGGNAVDAGNGSYVVQSPIAVPNGIDGSLIAAVEGHPWVDLDGDGLTSRDERIAVVSGFAYASTGGGDAMPRRQIAAIEKCNACHGRLALHGNNRTDSLEVCAVCHNPNATDISQRTAQCTTTLGNEDVSIDMKTMIHALHAADFSGEAYSVCGFGGRPISFDFAYPGRLSNCAGCHDGATYYPVDGADILATTSSVGTDAVSPTDDRVLSVNTAICASCHTDPLAQEHMRQNGGDFAATKDADSRLISAGVETCLLCHGKGRSADVGVVHQVANDPPP